MLAKSRSFWPVAREKPDHNESLRLGKRVREGLNQSGRHKLTMASAFGEGGGS